LNRFPAFLLASLFLPRFLSGAESSPVLNPFAPPPDAVVAAAADTLALQWDGVIVSRSKRLFAFYDPVKRQSYFLELDRSEAGQDYTVRGYDEERHVVRLEHRGRIMELPLAPPKMTATVAQPVRARPNQPRYPPAPDTPVKKNAGG
jgi:hypothetical protein